MAKLKSEISKESAETAVALSERIAENGRAQIRKKINDHCPYTTAVSEFIVSLEELVLYCDLGLQESCITRPCLIREINYELYVTAEGKTNYELMKNGGSPYAFDKPEGKIELHHIGQRQDSPLAELTAEEHKPAGRFRRLHLQNSGSWRTQETEKEFALERAVYWRRRAAKRYETLVPKKVKPLDADTAKTFETVLLDDIKSAVEKLFAECQIEDLQYLKDLADSYILMRQTEAESLMDLVYMHQQAQDSKLECVFCSSDKCIAYGVYHKKAEAIQRYKCNNCGKTFNYLGSNSIISGTQLSLLQWLKFIDCLYHGYTLERTAAVCGIHESTAHDHRMRLFRALEILDKEAKLSGKVVIDETYALRNYKGNHNKQIGFTLGRKTRHRGGENHTPGLSEEQVCIACALDETGQCVAHIAGKGGPTAQRLAQALLPSFDPKHIERIYSDKAPAIKAFARGNNFPITQVRSPQKMTAHDAKKMLNPEYREGVHQVQRVNAFHQRLKRFLEGFAGLSTKMLQGYLWLFAWRERNKNRPPIDVYKELLEVMTTPNLYASPEVIAARIMPDVDASMLPKEHQFKDEARARKIYDLYADGVPVTKIAKKYHIGTQTVYYVLKNCRKVGIAYPTKKEKEKMLRENRNIAFEKEQKKKARFSKKKTELFSLYQRSLEWTGSKMAFLKEESCQSGLTVDTIKNHLSAAKRILQLENLKQNNSDGNKNLSLEQFYWDVYCQYLNQRHTMPEAGKIAIYQKLADDLGYSRGWIQQIVKSFEEKNLLPTTGYIRRDVRERNQKIFEEYEQWTGGVDDFYEMTAEKYHLTKAVIRQIIEAFYVADETRFSL